MIARPHDININKAISSFKGTAQFYINEKLNALASLDKKIIDLDGTIKNKIFIVEVEYSH